MPPSIPASALQGARPQIPAYLSISRQLPPKYIHTYQFPFSTSQPQARAPLTLRRLKKISYMIRRRQGTTSPTPAQAVDEDRISKPLRILFCGSDHFSCASLTALHTLHLARPDLVESIDVLVRPGKPSGRGLKRIAVGPLFHLAHELNLPLHQRDTFTGWTLPLPGRVTHPTTLETTIHPHPTKPAPRGPAPFNLLIAVSFGLFVPPRILTALHYGGLNIHPSLLPDLRGPAPIPWAILRQRPHTGVTLQTLHFKAFDHGDILAQTAAPSDGIPVEPHTATTAALLEKLAPAGAAMLVRGLEDGVHVPPYRVLRPSVPAASGEEIADAPKITKADLAVDWSGEYWAAAAAEPWRAADLARRFRALVVAGDGTGFKGLWTYAYTTRQPSEMRLIWEHVAAVRCPEALRGAVRDVLRAKMGLASEGKLDLTSDVEEEVRSDAIGNVVFVTQKSGAINGRNFRIPVYSVGDKKMDSSVIIPIRLPYQIVDGDVVMVEDEQGSGEPDAIVVHDIKVEGQPSRSARRALEPFWERDISMQDMVTMDYAVDVIARRVG